MWLCPAAERRGQQTSLLCLAGCHYQKPSQDGFKIKNE